MKLVHLLFLTTCLLLSSCTTTTSGISTPAPTPYLLTDTLSPTPLPTSTLLQVATPSLPPESSLPALQTTGPYLVYLRAGDNGDELAFLDADGRGQKVVPLPTDLKSEIYPSMVSPDGKWLAYYTGSAGTCFGEISEVDTDLTLNLMDISSGLTRVVSRLLSADYPNNFERAFQELNLASNPYSDIISQQSLQDAFVCGIHTLAWSPDGQTLAFAGQMDGLSSDIYTYDVQSGAIHRLSRGPEEISWIDWSPDGEWILDGSNYVVGEGESYDVFASKSDGSSVFQLFTNTSFPGPIWYGPESFFKFEQANGIGTYKLQIVNLATNEQPMVWTGPYESIAMSEDHNWIAIIAGPTENDNGGPWLINLSTMNPFPVKTLGNNRNYELINIHFLGLTPEKMFLGEDRTDNTLYYVSTRGEIASTGVTVNGNGRYILSPDKKYLIVVLEEKIKVYSTDGTLIRSINLPAGVSAPRRSDIFWRPDSSGFSIALENAQTDLLPLYALDLLSGEMVLVDKQFSNNFDNNPIWVCLK